MTPRLSMPLAEAAESLGVTVNVLRDWVQRGRVPHMRVGKRVMFSVKSLEQWLREQEIPATDESAR